MHTVMLHLRADEKKKRSSEAYLKPGEIVVLEIHKSDIGVNILLYVMTDLHQTLIHTNSIVTFSLFLGSHRVVHRAL